MDYIPVEYVPPDEQQLTELETLTNVTQDGTMLKITYNYQGELYEVTDSSETHSKLQADVNFFAEFFQNITEKNAVQDNVGESDCSQINPDYTMVAPGSHNPDNAVQVNVGESDCSQINPDHTMEAQEDLNEIPNNDENDSKFQWDHKSILFLLSKYSERLAKFRSPTIKKITLWREIKKEFDDIGISQVTAQMIDHKFRNLKTRYKHIKDNNKKTGRGRQSWEYYQQMEDILENDKSVNFDTGIASMDDEPINLSQSRISSANRLSPTLISIIQNCYDNCDFAHFLSHIPSFSSSSDAFSDSDAEVIADTPPFTSRDAEVSTDTLSNSRHPDDGDRNCSPNGESTSPETAQSPTLSTPSKEYKIRKSTHAKQLYSQKTKHCNKRKAK
ncbi:uncharacterized protein LOC112461149 isoform X1 [Temnothorax curvispinosus]|uniref:Uncharacterized protein LOC112461149 isoform X1 n=1 Tax=Temnothorax curvispinosus TaxID=300111 RepID=A0A6J1QI43_9HYME|nr:uncharacterized protein LOC112461149 isoform X1 [Temnothorax curvispinosus]